MVSGQGLIRLRKEGEEEVTEFRVSGERLQVVEMIPGYTHSIVNLSDSEDLVTLMWCNDPSTPINPTHSSTRYENRLFRYKIRG